MCNYCFRNTCPQGCPNYIAIQSGYECDICKEPIYVNEEMFINENGDCCHYECAENMTLRELVKWLGGECLVISDKFDY